MSCGVLGGSSRSDEVDVEWAERCSKVGHPGAPTAAGKVDWDDAVYGRC